MSSTHSNMEAIAGPDTEATVGDYVALMKPRVMSLVVFTAFVGLVVAPGAMHPVLALAALICIAVGAGASGALNMWYDADIDARMARTAARPIPRGRVSRAEALTFGAILGAVADAGLTVTDLSTEEPDLEDVFLELTRAQP